MLPGVSRSNNANATTNSATPSSAKINAAKKLDAIVDTIVVCMSFPPAIAGSVVGVMRAIGARIVAHGARYVADLVRFRRRPAGPFHSRYAEQQQHAEEEVVGMLFHYSSSLSPSSP